MEVIGCLVPELRSEKHCGRGTQLFEKTQFLRCYDKFSCLCILSCYIKSTCVVVKSSLKVSIDSWESQWLRTRGTYMVSIDRKTTVYRPEA